MSVVRKLWGRKTSRSDSSESEDVSQNPLQAKALSQGSLQGTEPETESQAPDAPGSPSPSEESLSNHAVPSGLDQVKSSSKKPRCAQGLCVGYASDVGQLRDHNEDTVIVFQGVHLGHNVSGTFGFFVVADGMGGHLAGEVASALAARMVTHEVINSVYLPFLLQEAPSAAMTSLTEVLRNAVEKANDQVHDRVPGGGTTLTCALIMGYRAYIAHVGDSRAYMVTDRDMLRLTQDHSFVNRLIELGELSPEEAAVHPQRHVLYRAVGQGDSLDIDTYQQPLPPGSRLLLCSDGLSGLVAEEKIGTIIASASTPQEACQRLVEMANQAGGPDNITAVLIETPPD